MTFSAYEQFVRPLLFLLDPESAHDLALGFLRTASSNKLLLSGLRGFRPAPAPRTLFGLTFPNPVGLAAGFDKNGVALPALSALGFGFIEIGTVTARPQPGNPKPRLFRFADHQALINRLGFNNDGADRVANRLRQLKESGRWPSVPVGINIGKSKDTPLDQAPTDYLHSFRRLRNFADYIVLNVSSPNTPGLRSLQASEALSLLLESVQDENRDSKPILVKISPDLAADELDGVISTCEAHAVSAMIATNSTIDHSVIPPEKNQSGGLSGPPLRDKSTNLVRAIASRSSIPVIGCGGISDVESARQKMAAGAKLLQVYTGFIYRGPGLIREIVQQFDPGGAAARQGL